MTICAIVAALAGLPPAIQLTTAQVDEFHHEGVIVVRGLLTPTQLAATRNTGLATLSQVKLQKSRTFDSLHKRAFREVALGKRMAAVVHALMPSFDEVRVLRDAFIAKAPGDKCCGWHVDDSFFWPCPRNAPGPGLNVWIALSDYKAAHGGGMAVIKRSHTAPWADKVRRAIMHQDTCTLATLAPRLHRRCEREASSFDLCAGDALICSRRTLHRTVPFTEEGKRATSGEPLMRYTIRYMPGEATLDPSSRVVKEGLGGRSLRSLGHRYPRCWPSPDPKEVRKISRRE